MTINSLRMAAPSNWFCNMLQLLTPTLFFTIFLYLFANTATSQNFKLAKPGGANRALADKLSDIVSVEDFGASGKDTNDDSRAFQAAIDESEGKTIYLHGGVYYVNFYIDKSYIKIDGNGAVLRPFNSQLPVITIGANKAISDINLSYFEINGNRGQADGIHIDNNKITAGSDYLLLDRLIINFCKLGILVTGRTIWSRFQNCRFDWNNEGFRINTALPCNLLYFSNCTFNHNAEYGLWVENKNAANETFKTFQFTSCNFEDNGKNASEAYGAWFSGVESLLLENIYCEGNGGADNDSYGIKITGIAGRGISILGGWFVGSKYPIYIDGEKKWGTIWNVTAESVLKNSKDICIYANWANDEPKITVQQCMGGVSTKTDGQGNLPVDGIDWMPTDAYAITMQNRSWLKIFANGKDQQVKKIAGIYPGKTFGLINYSPTGNNLIIDAGLMFDGKPFIIKPNKAMQFITDGYPTPGKLIPITRE
jgi:hypothetical protein